MSGAFFTPRPTFLLYTSHSSLEEQLPTAPENNKNNNKKGQKMDSRTASAMGEVGLCGSKSLAEMLQPLGQTRAVKTRLSAWHVLTPFWCCVSRELLLTVLAGNFRDPDGHAFNLKASL